MNNVISDLVTTLGEHTEALAPTLQKAAQLDADIHSGNYTMQKINSELHPALSATRQELERAKETARRAAMDVISAHVAALEAEDALDANAMTDDCKLLNAGVKLNARDINTMLARNNGNRTMTQIILRYAREHDIDIGRTFYIGNEQAIRNTKNLDYIVDLYLKNWIDKPNAREMLGKLFGV